MSPLMVVSNHRDVYGQCRLLHAKLKALVTLPQCSDFSGHDAQAIPLLDVSLSGFLFQSTSLSDHVSQFV